MSSKRVDVEVVENTDALLTFRLWTRSNGVRTPYDFSGATTALVIKANATVADVNALATYSGTVVDQDGGLRFQTAAAAMVAGTYVYHLDVTKAGKRDTPAYGTFKVVNV